MKKCDFRPTNFCKIPYLEFQYQDLFDIRFWLKPRKIREFDEYLRKLAVLCHGSGG
jgi:hypothetical protein